MTTLTPNLFTISMGKKFKIVAICDSVNEANQFCERNPEVSVFKEKEMEIVANETVTMIFIAETKPFMLQEFPKGAVIMDFL
jgi:hypothetical protein